MQLLVGVATDIGLHQDKSRLASTETSPVQQRERDRALLGCLFMSFTSDLLVCVVQYWYTDGDNVVYLRLSANRLCSGSLTNWMRA